MSTDSTLTKEHLETLSTEELEEKKAQLDQELDKEMEEQHELMRQVQSSSVTQALSGIAIPRPTNQHKSEPLVQVTPSPQKQETMTNMSALAVATANYLNKRNTERQNVQTQSSAQKVAELTQKLGRGSVIKALASDSKKHIETLIDPQSSKEAVTGAAKSLQDNIATINQTLNSQIKDLQYADKKTFAKSEKSLHSDVKSIQSLGEEVSKHAAKLEARNVDLGDDLKVNFHQLGDNIKETAHNIGKAIKDIATKLNPQSLGLKVGG